MRGGPPSGACTTLTQQEVSFMSETSKVALITGSSRGIGAALAQRLAGEGFRVIVNYAGSAGPAAAVVASIEAAGGQALALQADVADPVAVGVMFEEVERAFQGIDVVVNCAGVMQLASVADSDDQLFDRTVAINFKGTFNVCREAARRLRDGGRIINFSSSVIGMRSPTYGVISPPRRPWRVDSGTRPGNARARHHCQCGGARACGHRAVS